MPADTLAHESIADRPQMPAQGFWDQWTPSALISLAMLVTGLILWVGKLRNDLDRQKETSARLDGKIEAQEARIQFLEKMAERHDERSEDQLKRMDRLEGKIDLLLDRSAKK